MFKFSMKQLLRHTIILMLFAGVLTSCGDSGRSKEDVGTSNLPMAQGKEREVFLVIDSATYAGEVGEILRDIYASPVPGLLKDEPWFKLRTINPLAMTETLRRQANMIFVTTLDSDSRQGRKMQSYFTEESLEIIRNEPDRFMLSSKDEYARGQEVIYLFGETKDQLVQNLEKNRLKLRNYMINRALTSITKDIKADDDEGIAKELREDRGYSIVVPKGFYIAREFENLVWIRQPDQRIDKSIFIYSIPYTDKKSFQNERIMALRDSVTKQFLYDIDKRDLYFEVEPLVPMYTEEFTFNGKYAVETRGMWKLNDQSVGGPFLSYMFVDDATNTLYYLDGFIIAPGQDKVEDLFELEAILSTFETANSGTSGETASAES